MQLPLPLRPLLLPVLLPVLLHELVLSSQLCLYRDPLTEGSSECWKKPRGVKERIERGQAQMPTARGGSRLPRLNLLLLSLSLLLQAKRHSWESVNTEIHSTPHRDSL